jgi:hypothetical protein
MVLLVDLLIRKVLLKLWHVNHTSPRAEIGIASEDQVWSTTVEVMTMEEVTGCPPKTPMEVTGCPPKSPMGPMVTVEPRFIAESVGVGAVVRATMVVAIWGVRILITVGISVARANGVAVTGATAHASGHCPKQYQEEETSRKTSLETELEHHRPDSDWPLSYLDHSNPTYIPSLTRSPPEDRHHHLGWEAAAWMLGQSCPCTMLNPPPNIDL